MLKSIEEFYELANGFAQIFDDFAKKQKLVGKALADHICYKCSTSYIFEGIRSFFEKENSRFIYQSIISNRRIAYICLQKPIETVLGRIWYLELSDQKLGGPQEDGFDHVEIYPTGIAYGDLIRLFDPASVTRKERAHHSTDDVAIRPGFICRCTTEPLVTKIKRDEMGF